MSDTSMWMLSGIAYDTQWDEWVIEGTKHRSPIEGDQKFTVRVGGTFDEAVGQWAAAARHRDRPLTVEQAAVEAEGHRLLRTA